MKRTICCALVFAAASLFACAASADVVAYSNFGPDDDFDDNLAWILVGPGVGTYWAQGFRFTSGAGGVMNRIDMPLRHGTGTNEYMLRLYDESLNVLLGQWDVQGAGGPPTPVSSFELEGETELVAGGVYWLVAYPGDETAGTWRRNSTGQRSMRVRDNFGQWEFQGESTMGAFRIIVEDTADCPPDWNGDGVVDSDDLFQFLADWAAGNADYNGDGVTDSDDLFLFLADWISGC